MIVLASGLFGVFQGYRTAKKRNGNRLDMAQYAAGYGIAFTLLGILLTLLIERLVS
ncbi:MAG: apolipoprotein acyltransferase [Pseudomonadota bacterium]